MFSHSAPSVNRNILTDVYCCRLWSADAEFFFTYRDVQMMNA